MTVKQLRSIPIRTAVIFLLPFLTAGCFFNLSEQKDFKSWYYGDPGMAGALGEENCDRYADCIQGERHRYYLHFRTPEVLLQPQGGIHYPERTTADSRNSGSSRNDQACERVEKGWETFHFDTVDAGLVDVVLPYRKATAVNNPEKGFGQESLAYAEGVVYNTGLAAVMKAPIYVVHDVLKTLYIPVAGTYYLLKPDETPETSSEIIQVQDAPGSDDDLRAESESTDESEDEITPPGPSEDTAVVAQAEPMDAAVEPPPVDVDVPLSAPEDTATEGEADFPPVEETEAVAPSETVPSADATADETAIVEQTPADADETSTPAAAETDQAAPTEQAPVDADEAPVLPVEEAAGSPMASEPETAGEATAGTQALETTGDEDTAVVAQTEPQADTPEKSDRVSAAVAALATTARGATGPPSDESETDSSDAAAEGLSGEIDEEDLLVAEARIQAETPADESVEADAMPMADAPDAAPDHPGEAAPLAADEAPVVVARISPAAKVVVAEVPPPFEALKPVRISKRKLRKKAAFIGFSSRAINVDENTKTYLRDHLWPVFENECRRNLKLVRRGDADYPSALDSLVRDQFGRLNSFELVTISRFSGLNAIVSGTIIDIRVSKEVSGILWYKSPEGRLRLTILVEVFDAETGTKLFDRTYIREDEVEELAPGADETLRIEDQPFLEEALRSVAEEMGEQVCETLNDQPWRAYVSGVNGERITLSAGESAGLVPGNILAVYNSQIIDGLNNQQFFLTGEKVGRIQIIKVFPNRSEAILIEGEGLRDYSVAAPE